MNNEYDNDTQELVQKIKEILCSCPPEMIQKRGNNFICNDDCNICNIPRLINLIKEEKAITTNKWKELVSAKDEYIGLLLAYINGWKSTSYMKGAEIRQMIEKLTSEMEGNSE